MQAVKGDYSANFLKQTGIFKCGDSQDTIRRNVSILSSKQKWVHCRFLEILLYCDMC